MLDKLSTHDAVKSIRDTSNTLAYDADTLYAHAARLLMPLIIIGIYCLALIVQTQVLINWDVSWLMHASQKLLAGGTYSKDFFELNPPLILYLYLPPVLAIKWFSLNIATALDGYIFLIASISLLLCYHLSQKIFSAADYKITQLFLSTIAIVFLLLPMQEFGQREHLLILFSLPYFLLISARLQGQSFSTVEAGLIGAYACLGFAIKPYFLIAPALVEIYYIFRTHHLFAWIRAETMTMAALLFLYLAAIFILHPDYIHVVIPLAHRLYYNPYETTWRILLSNPFAFFSLITIVLCAIQYKIKIYNALTRVLVIAVMGFMLAFLAQRTNWNYHISPAYQISVLLNAVLLGRLLLTKPNIKTYYLSIGAAIILATASFQHWTDALSSIMIVNPLRFFSFFALLFGVLLYFVKDLKPAYKILGSVIVIISASILLTYLIQRDDWNTHRLSLTLIFMVLVFGFCLPTHNTTNYRHILCALLAIGLFTFPLTIANQIYDSATYKKNYLADVTTFIHTYARYKPIYYFANSARDILPAIDYSDADPVTRTQDSGWIPGLLAYVPKNTTEISQDKTFLINMIADDLNQKTPAYVFIDKNKNHVAVNFINFDYLDYFSANPNFRTAWKKYHYFGTLEKAGVYAFDVYERN
jgi:hypothetical protein